MRAEYSEVVRCKEFKYYRSTFCKKEFQNCVIAATELCHSGNKELYVGERENVCTGK